jgi:predicted XRE-type DNA-binding protein
MAKKNTGGGQDSAMKIIMQLRKDFILSLSKKGFEQSYIAKVLNVHKSQISRILAKNK